MKIWLGLLGAALALAPAVAAAQQLTVLSSRSDTVSDGDVLIAMALPKGTRPADVKVIVGGTTLPPDSRSRAITGRR